MNTPCYLIDEAQLVRNLELLAHVRKEAGVRILLAQKAFSTFRLYPLIAQYLDGTTASGLFEARLAAEEMPGKENHVYNPAFDDDDFDEVCDYATDIVFNSPGQVMRFAAKARQHGISVGLRVNLLSSDVATPLYNPCTPESRLGTPRAFIDEATCAALDGLHFHALCEQNADALAQALVIFERDFRDLLATLKWVNFGGGHHITRPDYDVDGLIRLLQDFRMRHPHLTVYLEPGEAIALNAGELVTKVLAVEDFGHPFAILNTSAACHMPDVLEMPYRPRLVGAGQPNEKRYTYRLGGPTCLAGDVIGAYSFDHPLHVGDELHFEDMAIYTMVKNNTFNGMPLPDILLRHTDGTIESLRTFSYADFKSRL